MAKTPDTNTSITPEITTDVVVTPDMQNATLETAQEEGGRGLEERVINVGRVSRTQKGGRRIRFRALVVVGDKKGTIGLGLGKSSEVVAAVAKATAQAKKHMFTAPIVRNTIPHEIVAKFDSAKVLLKPAPMGTGIIAGSSVRPILELAGIENVVAKCLTRTTNKYNNAYATLVALQSLKDIKEIAPRRYVKKTKSQKAKAAVTATPVEAPVIEEKTAPAKKAAPKTAAPKVTNARQLESGSEKPVKTGSRGTSTKNKKES
jgi:small subunit ribosomal protein S5